MNIHKLTFKRSLHVSRASALSAMLFQKQHELALIQTRSQAQKVAVKVAVKVALKVALKVAVKVAVKVALK